MNIKTTIEIELKKSNQKKEKKEKKTTELNFKLNKK
jgi:hypothetical protein